MKKKSILIIFFGIFSSLQSYSLEQCNHCPLALENINKNDLENNDYNEDDLLIFELEDDYEDSIDIDTILEKISLLDSESQKKSIAGVISFIEQLLFHRDDIETLLNIIESLETELAKLKDELKK